MLWLVVVCLCALFSYTKFIKPLSYWQKRNVVHEKSLPILGLFGPAVLGTKTIQEISQGIYNKYENESFVGFYQCSQPFLFIRDLELIKQITVQNSDSFINRENFFDLSYDPIFHKSLFFQNGAEWKDMRVTLTPSFTANKMKSLFGLITERGEAFTRHFLNMDGDKFVIEAKDTFGRVTMDVIATCAFGVTCNSLNDKNNEFYYMGRKVSTTANWKLAFFGSCSVIVKFFKLRFIAKSFVDYFSDLINQNIKIREDNKIVRPDMLHLLIESKRKRDERMKENNNKISNDDIVPQAFIFFLAGFETMSTMCTFTIYELACNVHVQEKLQREIDETLAKCDGKLTYEALMEMPYLDMVISESMRKWPPMDIIFRTSIKDYTLHGEYSKPVKLEAGTTVVISTYCIHRDPKYFPNPDVFDPERFSLENKPEIQSFSYLPFGAGPRNCIGSRFSMLAGKVLLVYILSKFNFTVTEGTQIPLKLSKKSFTILPESGAWLEMEKRTP